MGAYDRITFNGVTLNRRTAAMLQEAERRLGYDLTLMQGSYNTGVGASAGTHDGGGAVDLAPYDWERKVRVLRDIGFAAWHRPALPGVWPEHIHAIALGDREAAPLAKSQMEDYKNWRNGLADHASDNTYHPSPIPDFNYEKWLKDQKNEKWASGPVYLSKLKKGTRNSDSVRRLQARLKAMDGNKIRSAFLRVNGNYGPLTERAVRRWQRNVAEHGPKDGSYVGEVQANRIFGPAYDVLP